MRIGASAQAPGFDSVPDNTTTVQLGETSLSQVAERLGTSLDALRSANPSIESDDIQPGQIISVPDDPSNQDGSGATQPRTDTPDAPTPSTVPSLRTLESSFDTMNMRAKLDSLGGGAGATGLRDLLDPPRNLADSGGGAIPFNGPDGRGTGSSHRLPTPDDVMFGSPVGGSNKPVAWPNPDNSHYSPAPANVHYRKDTGPSAGPHASGIPDPGMPKPATVQDKLVDAALDKIYEKVAGGLKSEVSVDHHPKLSPEQEALVDFASGTNQYKQYLGYAKTALELLKLSPGNSAIKQRLAQVFGDLDQLGAHLEQVSGVLGKAQKYAGIVKDALGITQSASDLVKKFNNIDFNNPKSVQAFADAFSQTNAQGQSVLQSARDSLINQGLKGGLEAAKGGLVLGALSFYLDMADEGLQAGLKNVTAYIDSRKKILDQIDNGGVAPPQPDIPTLPPPPSVQTYAGDQMQEKLDKMGRVLQSVENAFDGAKNKVKADLETKKQGVHNEFERDVFPKVYKQHRGQIEGALKAQIKYIESGRAQSDRAYPDDDQMFDALSSLKGTLEMMQRHDRSGLSMHDLRSEVNEMQVVLGKSHLSRAGNYVVDIDPSNPFKGTMLEKPYNDALAKTYQQKGVDDAGLQKAYVDAGLTTQNERQMGESLYRDLGLTQ
jgi:hypothetical protein